MTFDEFDPFVDAEVEDRLLAESRVEGRDRLREAIQLELGFRASLKAETEQRDERWWRSLWPRGFGSRVG